jgi:nucleoside diphosphate kinase
VSMGRQMLGGRNVLLCKKGTIRGDLSVDTNGNKASSCHGKDDKYFKKYLK